LWGNFASPARSLIMNEIVPTSSGFALVID
jgi:hypothetical protein